ncbi:hypothetical protein BS78_06G110500 [Paspalum vaginatum]|nr:hypothetical protein BS78_06G110500 [Paspalum vaginatum]
MGAISLHDGPEPAARVDYGCSICGGCTDDCVQRPGCHKTPNRVSGGGCCLALQLLGGAATSGICCIYPCCLCSVFSQQGPRLHQVTDLDFQSPHGVKLGAMLMIECHPPPPWAEF